MSDLARQCWFLTGPTASGKSAVGVELARRLGAEIITMDSMSLYRGMDVGTAKPSVEERRRVAHHLFDVIEADEEFSLAQYVDAARGTAAEISQRGQKVLFVGGTPLYLKALLRGIFEGPAADWELRRRLQQEADQHGRERLHERLAKVDLQTARRLHPNDTRRVVRALEVFEKTGKPISQWQRQFNVPAPREECRVFALDWPRKILYGRINVRVEVMFAMGFVDEVRRLIARRPLSRSANQAVGYREVIEHLEGRRDWDETMELIKTHTRQLAKRQFTWFRSLSECRPISVSEPLDSITIAKRIYDHGMTDESMA